MEKTLVLIKPDGVERKLIGEVIRRYEQKGMSVVSVKSLVAPRETVEEHYKEHVGKPFYDGLVEFTVSGMLIAMVVEGPNAVKCVRMLNGATRFGDAVPGSIRGDFANSEMKNIVHASDSVESAEREIAIWFK